MKLYERYLQEINNSKIIKYLYGVISKHKKIINTAIKDNELIKLKILKNPKDASKYKANIEYNKSIIKDYPNYIKDIKIKIDELNRH